MVKNNTFLIEQLEKRIGYVFQDKSLLLRALTHRSFSKKSSGKELHNETLEFLGDAVLSLVTVQELIEKLPLAQEGFLSQARAAFVCESNLAKAAKKLELGGLIRVDSSMRKSGPVDLPSVLADALEALIGGVYLDGGFAASQSLIRRILGEVELVVLSHEKDSKTKLQERIQAVIGSTPIYSVVQSSGPPHAPQFVVEVLVGDKSLATATGASKKEAAQQAAANVLEVLEALDDQSLKAYLQQSELKMQ